MPPLDCALLVQHCSNLGPVLRATSLWVAEGSSAAATGFLEGQIMDYLADEIDAAAETGSSSKVVSDGPRRRTLVPAISLRGVLSLDDLEMETQVACKLAVFAQSAALNPLTVEMHVMAGRAVCSAARRVNAEWNIERGSEAYETLLQAALCAGRPGDCSCAFRRCWRMLIGAHGVGTVVVSAGLTDAAGQTNLIMQTCPHVPYVEHMQQVLQQLLPSHCCLSVLCSDVYYWHLPKCMP
jgi:hypothetical protein